MFSTPLEQLAHYTAYFVVNKGSSAPAESLLKATNKSYKFFRFF